MAENILENVITRLEYTSACEMVVVVLAKGQSRSSGTIPFKSLADGSGIKGGRAYIISLNNGEQQYSLSFSERKKLRSFVGYISTAVARQNLRTVICEFDLPYFELRNWPISLCMTER